MASGGKREGAGRPFGAKNLSTVAKEEARDFVRIYITGRVQPLLDAQIDNIMGIRHLMMRDPKTGKCERITDVEQIDEALRTGHSGSTRKIPVSRPSRICSIGRSIIFSTGQPATI